MGPHTTPSSPAVRPYRMTRQLPAQPRPRTVPRRARGARWTVLATLVGRTRPRL
ncbi:hypothetical protein [Euzebya pacifica]|uniref:hypothetical protein n=1 Tax=Euzebya pacifica TaxID=1608957 RepID=UPI0013E0E1AD|nr:hypothetical protein [Euzebya pacifica]